MIDRSLPWYLPPQSIPNMVISVSKRWDLWVLLFSTMIWEICTVETHRYPTSYAAGELWGAFLMLGYMIFPLNLSPIRVSIRFVVDTLKLWALPLPPTLSVGYHMRPPKHWTWDLNINPPQTLQKVTANPAPAAPCQLSAPPSSCLPNDIPNETSGGSLSHTETVWANRREGGAPHQLSHVSQYSSVTNSSSFFHEISSTAPSGFLTCGSINPQRERERGREIKPSVTRSRCVGGVIREIDQYLRFISAHALESVSPGQSIISIPVVLHNVMANKLSLWL